MERRGHAVEKTEIGATRLARLSQRLSQSLSHLSGFIAFASPGIGLREMREGTRRTNHGTPWILIPERVSLVQTPKELGLPGPPPMTIAGNHGRDGVGDWFHDPGLLIGPLPAFHLAHSWVYAAQQDSSVWCVADPTSFRAPLDVCVAARFLGAETPRNASEINMI
ncbi:hypothetical protein CMUS01_04250 [Colletotrichum musicola]|uniref:Uncharacterized protein n=1 Tax=Colletotrichum musicola TaxID=2175873 RepID=A0A8H6NMW4_9PEZI|nr:hypothetical protein CMUS01_04250 [Colletotrichum musicola]